MRFNSKFTQAELFVRLFGCNLSFSLERFSVRVYVVAQDRDIAVFSIMVLIHGASRIIQKLLDEPF